MKHKIIIGFFLTVIFLVGIWIWNYLDSFGIKTETVKIIKNIESEEGLFLRDNLKTNTSKKSIGLDLVLDGGPGKNGIPAINKPKFIEIKNIKSQKSISDETLGISVFIDNQARFYPYSILYWHEIVNDIIGNKNISVTFCPLCGTAIVYNREIDGEIRDFGVSGKLYESNLLMYDNKNESLWSQSIGEAVIGEDLGTKLEVVKSDVMDFSQFKNNYPDGLVLSENTGYSRNYSRTPYGNYEIEEDLYFPVQNTDTKLHQKELMFVLPYKGDSYAFLRSELIKLKETEYKIGDEILKIEFINGEITASIGDKIIPGYIEMWFSWFTQHQGNKNVWIGE